MVYNTELSGCIDMNTKPCGNVNHTIASNTELDGCIDVNNNPDFTSNLLPFPQVSLSSNFDYIISINFTFHPQYGSSQLSLLLTY